jgi:long-chain fatty acid transport protein
MLRRFRWLPLALAPISLLGAVDVARASGFATARFGSEHGHPTATNPTAIYYNPAAMAESRGTHLFADGLFALRRATYTHRSAATDVPEPADAQGANTGKGTLLNVVAAPMIGATHRLGPFALGAGAYVPFGGSERWDERASFANHPRHPGPVDGAQRWYSIEGEIQSIYLTLALAYQLGSSGLSVGASLNAVRSSIDTITARTVLSDNDVTSEGRSQVDASGWQWAFGAGVLYQALRDRLWFGVSYQSRPNVSGGMALAGTLRNHFAGQRTDDAIDFHQDLPDVYRAGARYRPSRQLELRLFADLTRWSAVEDHCVARRDEPCVVRRDGSAPSDSATLQSIRRDWQDAFGVRAGASYWVSEPLELFAGAGYDGNAVPDETLETSFMDFHDISVAAGARWRATEGLHIAASYLLFFNIARDTAGESIHASLESPSHGPDSGGRYTEWVGALNVNVELAF